MARNFAGGIGRVILLAFAALLPLASRSAAALPRPIVVVFPGTVNPTGGGVASHKSDDDVTTENRTRAGVLAFNFCLSDSGAVIPVRYDPKLSMVVRALLESHVTVAQPDDPTPDERLKIAKAMGAIYYVAVSTLSPADAAPGTSTIEMTIDGVDVGSRKTYTDHIRMSSGSIPMRQAPTADGNDRDSIRHFSGNDRLDNVLQSAANTLVVRLLGAPLHEFARSAAPANLLPAPQNPAASPDVIRPVLPQAPTTPAVTAAPVATEPVAQRPTPTRAAPATTPDGSTPAEDDATRVKRTTVIPSKIILPPQTGAGSAVYDAAGRALANPDEEAGEAIRQAAALQSDGDANAAIEMLRQEIDRQPLSPPLRIALAKTYLGAGRGEDAESEARRALIVLPVVAPSALADLTGVLTRAISSSDSSARARITYTRLLAERPDWTWVRLALAQLDESEGQSDEAEAEYKTVLKTEPTNSSAARGLAQLLIGRGDLPGAQVVLDGLGKGPEGLAARYDVVVAIFDVGTTGIASRLSKNRAAWEAKTISNDAIGNATTAQFDRLDGLLTLLKSITPAAAGRPEADVLAYRRRILAANFLRQAAAAQIRLIQTGDPDAASEATLQLDQFQQTLNQAQGK